MVLVAIVVTFTIGSYDGCLPTFVYIPLAVQLLCWFESNADDMKQCTHPTIVCE